MRGFVFGLVLTACVSAQAAKCSWNEPGHNPYKGSKVSAILSESDFIPDALDRILLAIDVRTKAPTDRLHIWRDSVTGKDRQHKYAPDIYGMYFGKNQRCDEIDRSQWKEYHAEEANAWCRGSRCVVVVDVCGNVSFIRRERVVSASAVNAVPEPNTLALVGLALTFILFRRKGKS